MGLLDRWCRGAAQAATPERAEQLARLEESARDAIRPAFLEREEVRELLNELHEDDEQLTRLDVRRVVDEVWQERVREQAHATDDGDYSAVVRAFAALEYSWVIARMRFACCGTCGHAEIGGERETDRVRGYVFFHEQDAEQLGPGSSDLFLAYGAFVPDPSLAPDLLDRARAGEEDARRAVAAASDESIGAEVVTALRQQGLDVEWSGSVEHRIRVRGVDWRKPLPALGPHVG